MRASKRILIVWLLLFHLTVSGQELEYFRLYAGVSFMPGGGFHRETYEQSSKKSSHFSLTRFYNKPLNVRRAALPMSKNMDLVISDFDSLSNLQKFTFAFDNSVVEKIKGDSLQKAYYHISDIDIDNFFRDNKMITLDLSEIKTDSLDAFTVYDGKPFAISLRYKIMGKDSVQLSYSGNLEDGVKTKDIKDWLIFYILVSKYHLFGTNKYMTEFFDEKHFYSVLYRYINWRR